MVEKQEYIDDCQKHFKKLSKKELLSIFKELDRQGIDWQKIDLIAFGEDCDYEMILQNLFVEYAVTLPFPKTDKGTNEQTHTEAIYKNDMGWLDSIIPKIRSLAVVGESGSGKSAWVYRLLERVRKALPDREIYVLKHPKPELLKPLGYKVMHSLEEMEKKQDIVLWIDEPQMITKWYSGHGNPVLTKILSMARQRDIFLIISTCVSQYLSRELEGQIDAYVVKDLDVDLLKQGSRIKKIIQNHVFLDTDGFRLEPNEYLFYCRKFFDRQGKYKAELPKYWNEQYSKAFKEVK